MALPHTKIAQMKSLDITNPETWPPAVTQLVRDAIEPLLGDKEALGDICHKIDSHDRTDNIVRVLISETRKILSHIPSFIAYHTCRPLDINCYRKKGLLVRTDDRLRDIANKWVGDIPGWESACEKVLSIYRDPIRGGFFKGQAGLSFIPFRHYGEKGCYFLNDVFAQLGDKGASRQKEIFEKTKPTVLVCELPLDWVLGPQTDGDLLGNYVVELLLATIASMCGREYCPSDPRAIGLCIDLPPEKIIEIRVMSVDPDNSRSLA